jgi:hypothetical protein
VAIHCEKRPQLATVTAVAATRRRVVRSPMNGSSISSTIAEPRLRRPRRRRSVTRRSSSTTALALPSFTPCKVR